MSSITAVAAPPDPPPPLMVTSGVASYWLPLLIRVILSIIPPSRVANAVEVSPLGPSGSARVTVGVEVYPLPPFVTVIDLTFLYN